QGRIAGYLASTSTVLALKAAGTPIVAWNTDQFAKIPGQVLVTTREMVEKRPETCQKFLNAVNMAVTELLDPNKIDAAIAKMKPL
ncbi:ABC transporter substrate-binding protein, partial [Acinetobacter baumannii]